MSENINLILPVGASLLTLLITQSFAYCTNKRQKKFELKVLSQKNEIELKKALLEKQKLVYHDFMISLQNAINAKDIARLIEMQKALIALLIYCDDTTAKCANEYFNAMTKNLSGLKSEDHQQFQQKIMNGMRGNLSLGELEFFELIHISPVAASSETSHH